MSSREDWDWPPRWYGTVSLIRRPYYMPEAGWDAVVPAPFSVVDARVLRWQAGLHAFYRCLSDAVEVLSASRRA